MLSFLIAGTILGLSAGFAPGPLLALVVTETLQHDRKAGIRVALAPVLTDLPIIVLTLFLLARLSRFHHILGIIAIIGAGFVLYLGIKNIQTRGVRLNLAADTGRSLQKGIVVNALSPHPYLFWFAVGGPATIRAMAVGLPAAIAFILSFYILLVGAKIILAFLVDKSRTFLQDRKYIITMRVLGFLLILLAGFLLRDGLKLLGIL